MAKYVCEMCGCEDVSKENGGYVCPVCGYKSVPHINNGNDEAQTEPERLKSERQEELERIKRKTLTKKIAMIAAAITSVIVVFVIILTTIILPSHNYSKGLQYWETNKITACYYFTKAKGYKDAEIYVNEYAAELQQRLVNNRWSAGLVRIQMPDETLNRYYSAVFSNDGMLYIHSTEKEGADDRNPLDYEYTIVFTSPSNVYIEISASWMFESEKLPISIGGDGKIRGFNKTTEFFDRTRTLYYVPKN